MADTATKERPGPSHLHTHSGSDPDGSDCISFSSPWESSNKEVLHRSSCDGILHPGKTATHESMASSPANHHKDKFDRKQFRRPRVPKASAAPRQAAKVKALAEEKASGPVNNEVEAQILIRIRKCLERANHPTTPEMEAKAALHMSSRLMAQYNVTQADVLAQAIDSEEQARYAGQPTVSITNTKDPFAKAISQTWVHDVAEAMEIFFDCKSYSSAKTFSIDWTFYGIAANTVAAATAFEMAHNLTLEWARGKKRATNSYCLGVGNGLREMAKGDKKQEVLEAKRREQEILSERVKQEQLERQKELDRLNAHGGVPDTQKASYTARVADDDVIPDETANIINFSIHDGSSSDTDDDVERLIFSDAINDALEAQPTFKEEDFAPLDPEADFEVELQRILKRERSCTPLVTIKPESSASQTTLDEQAVDVKPKLEEEDKTSTESSHWTSASQLIVFRATANKIADEHLKSTGTILRSGGARNSSIRDYPAYEQGKKDSREIDVKRRRIE